jgi:hypothetical protein
LEQIKFRIADCGLRIADLKKHGTSDISICNPKSEIRNLFCYSAPDFTAIPDEIRQSDD